MPTATRLGITVAVAAVAVLAASPARAQSAAPGASSPVRDAQGRFSFGAVVVSAPHRIDGRLDEPHYGSRPIADFVQMEPSGGQPATEKTEVWVFFDRRALYVSFRVWESRPDLMIANEMRRDSNNIRLGDCVGFSLDTFHDGRNAFQFEINPVGGRTDGQSFNERQYSSDWNPVWDLAIGHFEGGWTIEAEIPFRSLRYQPGSPQAWGFNARRNSKWKNEIAYLAVIPPAFGIGRGSFSASRFPTLTGLEVPSGAKNVELKPYAVADVTTDPAQRPPLSNEVAGDFGLDLKYGVTQNLTADFTYNTDFAQVEADEQQINLTRFNLFFPEKRDFFLENQGTFTFGASTTAIGQVVGDTPLLFYSRRIGLNQGLEVPLLGGGRLTGRVGRYSLGLVNIQTRDAPKAQARATNYSVVRLRRDILRRSSVGMLATHRSPAQSDDGSNDVYGVDGAFAFFANLAFNAYWARTRTAGLNGGDSSYRAQMEYVGDRYGATLDHLLVGPNFNPEVGFVRRRGVRETIGQLRFSPRPRSLPSIRKFSGVTTFTRIDDARGVMQTQVADAEFAIERQNSDRFSVGATDTADRPLPFTVTPRVRIAPGDYRFATGRLVYVFGQQRPVSGTLTVEHGGYYNGRRTSLTFRQPRVNLSHRLSLEPTLSINRLRMPGVSESTNLVGSRVTYTVTPLMFASALVQYNSTTHRVSANVRVRWEYCPGSEFFVVFNEERDTADSLLPNPQNRALIIKLNRLFRF
jgi:hypothetical protein